MRRRSAPSGYTIVELLLVLTIIAIVSGGALALLAGRLDAERTTRATLDLIATCEAARCHAQSSGETLVLRIEAGGGRYELRRLDREHGEVPVRGMAGRPRVLPQGVQIHARREGVDDRSVHAAQEAPRWGSAADLDDAWVLEVRDPGTVEKVRLQARTRQVVPLPRPQGASRARHQGGAP